MRVKVTNNMPYDMVLPSTNPLEGLVRITPGGTETVTVDDVPSTLKTLKAAGKIKWEIVSEERPARAAAPESAVPAPPAESAKSPNKKK